MIIGTAGHIDHGKTLLVKALTGVNTDRLKEEEARGISIDLGFAYVQIPGSQSKERPAGDILGLVDVPGHERFVHTMLAGSAGVDFALIVIAADDGVMPQTREHLQILNLLGVAQGVVALNKIDLVDETRRLTVEQQIRVLLAGTSLEGADILPVSAAKGTGVAELKQRLLEEAGSQPDRVSRGTFRMAIDRSFTLKGAGSVVTGAVRSGAIQAGDRVLVLPVGQEVRVRTLHVQGREGKIGRTGERCALNLVGIEKAKLNRGDWLVDPATTMVTARFDAELKLLATEERAIRTWSPVHLHFGTSRLNARVVLLEGDKLEPGSRTIVQIVADRSLPLVFGDQFVIRDVGAERTIGGGHVIDPRASQRRRRTPARQAVRAALSHSDPVEALDTLLSLSPGIVDFSGFVIDRGLSESETRDVLELVDPAITTSAGRTFVASTDALEDLGNAIEKKLVDFHADEPELPGMPFERLRLGLVPRLRKPQFAAALEFYCREGKFIASASGLRLPSHSSGIRAADQQLWDRISRVMETRMRQPPPLSELADALNQPISDVRRVCKTMVRMGELVEVTKDRFFLKVALMEFGRLAHEIAKASPKRAFTAAEFRDGAGCGRATAIKVLEYFDRRGITGRRGDMRIVSKSPTEVFRD